MIISFVLITLLTAVSSAFTTSFSRRSTAEILDAISNVDTAITKLDNLITAYPMTGGTISDALDIHTNATALDTAINSATTIVNANGHIDHPDADTILNAVLAFEPVIDHALVGIVDKKPAFAALPIGGLPALILSDLKTLKGSSGTFANALIDEAPADLVTPGMAYRDGLLQAFDASIAAYE